MVPIAYTTISVPYYNVEFDEEIDAYVSLILPLSTLYLAFAATHTSTTSSTKTAL